MLSFMSLGVLGEYAKSLLASSPRDDEREYGSFLSIPILWLTQTVAEFVLKSRNSEQ
jgi:hypothetical protein